MTPDLNASLASLIEALVNEADPQLRDRALLEALVTQTRVVAAGLWVCPDGDGPETGDPGNDRSWRPILERGDLRALPTPGQVQAVADGDLDPILPASRLVVVQGERALVLGGLPMDLDPEDLLDTLEALLIACSLLEVEAAEAAGGRGTKDQADWVVPALPSSDLAPSGTHQLTPSDLGGLSRLLARLRTTREVLAGNTALDPRERERLNRALDAGLEQAGGFLIEELEGQPAPRAACLGPVLLALLAAEQSQARKTGIHLDLDLDDSTLGLPLGLDGSTMAGLVLGLFEVALGGHQPSPEDGQDGERAQVEISAHFEFAEGGGGVLLEIDPGTSNPPSEFSLRSLAQDAATHAARVWVRGTRLGLWIPARSRGAAA
jgi:hypothetical protein